MNERHVRLSARCICITVCVHIRRFLSFSLYYSSWPVFEMKKSKVPPSVQSPGVYQWRFLIFERHRVLLFLLLPELPYTTSLTVNSQNGSSVWLLRHPFGKKKTHFKTQKTKNDDCQTTLSMSFFPNSYILYINRPSFDVCAHLNYFKKFSAPCFTAVREKRHHQNTDRFVLLYNVVNIPSWWTRALYQLTWSWRQRWCPFCVSLFSIAERLRFICVLDGVQNQEKKRLFFQKTLVLSIDFEMNIDRQRATMKCKVNSHPNSAFKHKRIFS